MMLAQLPAVRPKGNRYCLGIVAVYQIDLRRIKLSFRLIDCPCQFANVAYFEQTESVETFQFPARRGQSWQQF
jgi:hypothetical protein